MELKKSVDVITQKKQKEEVERQMTAKEKARQVCPCNSNSLSADLEMVFERAFCCRPQRRRGQGPPSNDLPRKSGCRTFERQIRLSLTKMTLRQDKRQSSQWASFPQGASLGSEWPQTWPKWTLHHAQTSKRSLRRRNHQSMSLQHGSSHLQQQRAADPSAAFTLQHLASSKSRQVFAASAAH